MTPISIDALVERARRRLLRLEPVEAEAALRRGALLIDTRTFEQRKQDGIVPGSLLISRNVLEWRVDPQSGYTHPRVTACTAELIVMCQEGYSSSLAADTLHELGITQATDLVGGYVAWKAAGLPTAPYDEQAI